MADNDDLDFLDALASDAASEKPQINLAELVALVDRLDALDGWLDRAAEKIKERKKERDELAQKQIPDLLAQAGVKGFPLADGRIVEVTTDLTCSVPKKRKPEIIQRLREMNLDPLITNTITVDVPKGKDNVAGELMGKATELELEAIRAEDVNTASLKAALRERLKTEPTLDLAFFGAFEFTEAKVKQSKKG